MWFILNILPFIFCHYSAGLFMVTEQNVIEWENRSPIAFPQQNVSIAAKAQKRPIKLALVSCGLGHINRGVEVSTARWYEALKDNDAVDVRLFSGGDYPQATSVINFPRDWLLKTILSPITK